MCFVLTSQAHVSLQNVSQPHLRNRERLGETHPSRYCIIFPFFDQAIHFGSEDEDASDLFRLRITRGASLPGGFATLQTLRSPLADIVASMSDFCFDDDACHANDTIGEGPREVVIVWRMVNVGNNVAIRIDPFWYLDRTTVSDSLKELRFRNTYPIA
jgi:hypothetical protein